MWSILIQICRALRYIHVRKGVAHRDLSPTNVMVQQQQRGGVGGGGGGGAGDRGGVRVKLADFGLAKRKGAGSVMHSAVGTLPYSCPEIIQHQEYTDKASEAHPFGGREADSLRKPQEKNDLHRIGT